MKLYGPEYDQPVFVWEGNPGENSYTVVSGGMSTMLKVLSITLCEAISFIQKRPAFRNILLFCFRLKSQDESLSFRWVFFHFSTIQHN